MAAMRHSWFLGPALSLAWNAALGPPAPSDTPENCDLAYITLAILPGYLELLTLLNTTLATASLPS